MINVANSLAEEMLEKVINWVYSANDEVNHWENVREAARDDASGVSGYDEEEERTIRRRKADTEFRISDVGRTASREIQRAALEELGRLQREVFVRRIDVSEPDTSGKATATAVLRKGWTIPDGYRFYWKAGDAEVERKTPDDKKWLSVRIDASTLPIGDTTVEAILGKDSAPPVRDL